MIDRAIRSFDVVFFWHFIGVDNPGSSVNLSGCTGLTQQRFIIQRNPKNLHCGVSSKSTTLIDMEDVVVVTKDENDNVKLHQAVNLTAAGAVSGSFWGILIGAIFLNPLLGAAMGAGAGALSGAATDIGISNNFMKECGETLKPGSSALFVLTRKVTPDKVLDRLKDFKGKVLKTSLSDEQEAALRKIFEETSEQN